MPEEEKRARLRISAHKPASFLEKKRAAFT